MVLSTSTVSAPRLKKGGGAVYLNIPDFFNFADIARFTVVVMMMIAMPYLILQTWTWWQNRPQPRHASKDWNEDHWDMSSLP